MTKHHTFPHSDLCVPASGPLAAMLTRDALLSRPSERLTPGAYIRQCRERSGKSIEQCAASIAAAEHDRRHARNDLTLLEDDQPGDYYRLVMALRDRAVVRFDMSTFFSLAAATADSSFDEWGEC